MNLNLFLKNWLFLNKYGNDFILYIAVALPTLVTGPVKFALVAFAVETAEVTNSVVANCVELVPAVAVGAAGVPVNVGD
uniref:hypothetical protein n=1 Tax=Algoriphagus sp. TaxID=1872435 RepID=UPI004048D692